MISLVLSKRGSYRYHNKRKIHINGLFVPFMGKIPWPCGEILYYRLNHLYTAYRSVVTFLCIFIQADAKRNVNRVPLKKVLIILFFGFAFSCYLIVIAFQNRIILIRFCILLMWFQSCCTQIVPKYFPSSLQQQFIYIFFYFRF